MTTLAGLLEAFAAGERTPVEAVEEALRALEALDGAVLTLAEDAVERAARATGPWAGVPVLVKDNLDTAGLRTTQGSAAYVDRVPSTSADVVQRVEAAGAVVVGKSNLPELAWGVTGHNAHFGSVRNPRRPWATPGGSSSGNAAALAAGAVPLALGTDTNGSCRLPAACCDVVGMRPTLGSTPSGGMRPLAPSFDVVGPMARTVADCAALWSVLTGRPVPSAAPPRRVGLLVRTLDETAERRTGHPDDRALAWADAWTALGCHVEDLELPAPEEPVLRVFDDEVADSIADLWPDHADLVGEVMRERAPAVVEDAQDRLAVAAARAAVAPWQRRARDEVPVDVIVAPVTGRAGLPAFEDSERDVSTWFSDFTGPFSRLDWAAIAIGPLQVAARTDEEALAAALAFERAHGLSDLLGVTVGDAS